MFHCMIVRFTVGSCVSLRYRAFYCRIVRFSAGSSVSLQDRGSHSPELDPVVEGVHLVRRQALLHKRTAVERHRDARCKMGEGALPDGTGCTSQGNRGEMLETHGSRTVLICSLDADDDVRVKTETLYSIADSGMRQDLFRPSSACKLTSPPSSTLLGSNIRGREVGQSERIQIILVPCIVHTHHYSLRPAPTKSTSHHHLQKAQP